jgi:hypothetical protein
MMKPSRFVSSLLVISILYVLLPAPAKAAMWEAPVGPGESFRWVFVTSLWTDAMTPDIEYYNNFINYDVMSPLAGTPLAGIAGKSTLGDVGWKAIASTMDSPDVMTNIGFSAAGIYSVQGDWVAPDTPFLFMDVPLLSPISIDEYGAPHDGEPVWTGADPLGGPIMPLGLPVASVGICGDPDQWLCSWMGISTLYPFSLYAISEELTVVPVPGALLLAAMGLLSSMLGLKRLQREHQE